ncbi:MAG TPA: RidA family protein [Chloroflexota bacterium]|jgi:enamine deaminase RidA (YjgF/YER057c/UK114 family)|nr:RidA family protein [Chloroflexota bacterium]
MTGTVEPGRVEHLNPEALVRNPAFSNVVVVSGAVKTIYVGGQDAVDASGAIVGKGDIRAQTEQILKNLRTALAAAGAGLEHVIKWNVYVVQGQSLQEGAEVVMRQWDRAQPPPAITVAVVAGLAHPDFLAEIDAVAVVPQ